MYPGVDPAAPVPASYAQHQYRSPAPAGVSDGQAAVAAESRLPCGPSSAHPAAGVNSWAMARIVGEPVLSVIVLTAAPVAVAVPRNVTTVNAPPTLEVNLVPAWTQVTFVPVMAVAQLVVPDTQAIVAMNRFPTACGAGENVVVVVG